MLDLYLQNKQNPIRGSDGDSSAPVTASQKAEVTNPRVVVSDLDRSIRAVVWSGDSKGLLFRYDDLGVTKLGYATLDGQHKQVAGKLGRGDYSLAQNGNFAFTYTFTDTPSDVAGGSLSGPEPRVIIAVNEDLFSHKKLGEVEEIWYESSLDGRRIHGWFIKPPDFDPSRKYPLIIGIHGGPFSNYGFRFDLEKQFMAAAGYIVLYTNPRGSTSCGEEFGNLRVPNEPHGVSRRPSHHISKIQHIIGRFDNHKK